MSCEHDSTANADKHTGCVKWFNSKAGYGFVTATVDGSDKDVFVHHSSVVTKSEQYKYLVQGEYVQFTLSDCDGHEYQASNVCGPDGGKLMCETHFENRSNRPRRQPPSDERRQRQQSSDDRPRRGPRPGQRMQVTDDDGNKWTLVKSRQQGRRNNRDRSEN